MGCNTRALGLVLVVASVSGWAPAQSNDTCGNAVPVGIPSVTPGTTASATVTSGLAGCSTGPDLWYTFVAPYNGTAEVSTCGFLGGSANFDTVINIYSWLLNPCTTGCGLCGGIVTCNDDYCGTQSYVSFPISTNTTYHILIGGYSGAAGNFALAVQASPNIPSNDHCASALPIAVNGGSGGENAGATTGGGDPLPSCGLMTKDVWYMFVAPSCGAFTATTCGSATFDTVVAVWQGPCGSLTQVGCIDDNCAAAGGNLHSTVAFAGTQGTTYYISVGGFAGGFGSFSLFLTGSGAAPMTLAFINNGPGTFGYSVASGPPNGLAFTAITLSSGLSPNGWFYGLDIAFPDLVSEWLAGFPFVTPLSGSCNVATVGPFGGLPGGLAVWGVTVGFPSGSLTPAANSLPVSGTVP